MAKNTTTIREFLHLDIHDDPPPPDAIRFFATRSFGASTWVVSLFVVLHLVAFATTMFVNNCPSNSDQCLPRVLGRFSFQPVSQNPLFGPSSPALAEMGALHRESALLHHQEWRIVTSMWLHAGVVHLFMNIFTLILLGIRLEQDYGPLRIGTIHMLSGLLGGSISVLFARDISSVGSSSGLFGLLGAMLFGLLINWQIYDDKHVALAVLVLTIMANMVVGLMPIVDNIANLGGFVAGILLGCVLLFNPQLGQMERKKGLYEYNLSGSMKWKQKFDRPVKRIIALVLFIIILVGACIGVGLGANGNEYCSWCRYLDCFPNKRWSCGWS